MYEQIAAVAMPAAAFGLSTSTCWVTHHLCEVVGAEAEELCGLGQVARAQRTAGHLDHGAHLVVNLGAFKKDKSAAQQQDVSAAGPEPACLHTAINDDTAVECSLASLLHIKSTT
jgi:hypothetical protein